MHIHTFLAVYRIPPLNVNEGYRANDWGDLAAPLWKGRLRILENSKGAALQLEDPQTGPHVLAPPFEIAHLPHNLYTIQENVRPNVRSRIQLT